MNTAAAAAAAADVAMILLCKIAESHTITRCETIWSYLNIYLPPPHFSLIL
jgi:hypothetical protein